MISRRNFMTQLAGLGAFMILPGAGRIWKATKQVESFEWTYEQLSLYNKLPYYLAKQTIADERAYIVASWEAFGRLLGSSTYPTNAGSVIRSI